MLGACKILQCLSYAIILEASQGCIFPVLQALASHVRPSETYPGQWW